MNYDFLMMRLLYSGGGGRVYHDQAHQSCLTVAYSGCRSCSKAPSQCTFQSTELTQKAKKPRISHARDKGRCYATHRGSILDRPIAIKTQNNRATSMNRDESLLEARIVSHKKCKDFVGCSVATFRKIIISIPLFAL